MDVVLPAPLTPATMITVGRYSPMTSSFSSGLSNCDSESARMFLACTGRVAPVAYTRRQEHQQPKHTKDENQHKRQEQKRQRVGQDVLGLHGPSGAGRLHPPLH